jgi:hypothetical protein
MKTYVALAKPTPHNVNHDNGRFHPAAACLRAES